jgi:hypothetical protein
MSREFAPHWQLDEVLEAGRDGPSAPQLPGRASQFWLSTFHLPWNGIPILCPLNVSAIT